MATSTPDNSLQQQQAAQAAAQARQAQKSAKTDKQPSVQFSQVIQAQQAAKSPTTISLMQKNPVAGAAVVKAAVSAGGSSKAAKVSGTAANVASSTSASTATGTSSTSIGDLGGTSSSSSSGQALLQATQQLQELNQDFNLQYLNLQENQQSESRQYTALSNVSKTKSDTAKNSLTNVK